RRDEAELADRVEAVGLGHEHDVEPGLLEVGEFIGGLGEAARVAEKHPYPHEGSVTANDLRRRARAISTPTLPGTPAAGGPRAGARGCPGGPGRRALPAAAGRRGSSCPRPWPRAATATPAPGTRSAARRWPGPPGAAPRPADRGGRPAGPARRRRPCRWPPRGRA